MGEIKVQKCMIDYFTCLGKSYDLCTNNLNRSYKIVFRIHNLIDRQNKIRRSNVINTELELYDDLINRLMFHINQDINKQMKQLQECCNAVQKEYDFVNKKHSNLENICKDIDFNESSTLVHGSAFQPSLSDLMEYSRDGTSFIHGVWSQLKFVILDITANKNNCDFNKLLSEYFHVDDAVIERIKFILMMTQFCDKTELL